MARIARRYLDTSFFHIMVQGINKEYIFNQDRYINRYLQLMKENLEKEKLNIIAYCIMNNHAHLLMQVKERQELSKYMQKVNSQYAKYYNYMENERVGYVFRDRYKTEPILSRRQLIQCIKYIHQNPVKANMVKRIDEYKYSSYYFYRNKKIQKIKIFTLEEIEDISNINNLSNDEFMDVDFDIEKKMECAILEFIKKEKVKLFEIFEKDDILRKLVKYLKKVENIKYTDMMRKLGITRGVMERLKR